MKKRAIFSLLSATVLSCSQSPKGNTVVKGEIEGLKQGTLYIQKLANNQLQTVDSAVVSKTSTFETSFDLDEAEVLYLTLDRGQTISEDNHILFFAEPGKITINTTLEHFSYDATVSGSKTHEDLKKYYISKKQWIDRKNELIKEQLNAAKNKNTQKSDELHKAIINNNQRIMLNAVQYSLKNPESIASAYITLTDVLPLSDKYLDTIYNSLRADVKKHKYAQLINEYLTHSKSDVNIR